MNFRWPDLPGEEVAISACHRMSATKLFRGGAPFVGDVWDVSVRKFAQIDHGWGWESREGACAILHVYY